MKQGRPSKLLEHFRQAGLNDEACDLLMQLLSLDPKKRLDARTAFGVRPSTLILLLLVLPVLVACCD